MKYRALGLASLLLAAGCGGGSGSAPTPHAATPTNPGNGQLVPASLTLTFPVPSSSSSANAKTRTPRYVSPSSSFVDVLINSVGGGTVPTYATADQVTALTISGGSPNCVISGGNETCTVAISTPAGSVSYSITVTDSSKNPLATTTFTATVAQGGNNALTTSLSGVVAGIFFSPGSLNAGSSSTRTYTPVGADFDANGITGTTAFAQPWSISDNDASGQTTIALLGSTASSSVTFGDPTQKLSFTYSGRAINPFVWTASIPAFTALDGNMNALPATAPTIAMPTHINDIVLSGTTDDTNSSTDSNYRQQTVFFSQPSGTAAIGASENGWSDSPWSLGFLLKLDPTTCGGVAAASPSPPTAATTWTITAAGNAGLCKAQIVEDNAQPGTPLTGHTANTPGAETHDGTFWISVTSGSITGNAKARHT
ncbi:MAG TPA: hypothetical protein VGN14_02280 [Candidatus Elarobacter sp.]